MSGERQGVQNNEDSGSFKLRVNSNTLAVILSAVGVVGGGTASHTVLSAKIDGAVSEALRPVAAKIDAALLPLNQKLDRLEIDFARAGEMPGHVKDLEIRMRLIEEFRARVEAEHEKENRK